MPAYRTRASVTAKWERKVNEMKKKADFKYNILLQNKKKLFERDWGYEVEKNERKKQAYINKKEAEYKRRMLNEIRKIEGKPTKDIKNKKKLDLENFAASLMQENSRLRDSNASGIGNCISCNARCSWSNHQGGHRHSRRFKNLVLEPKNINLQCRKCNFATGPQGDTVRKERVNSVYDENLDKKYGEGTARRLEEKKNAYIQNKDSGNWDYKTLIPSLIKENKELWATKNFRQPSQNWEKVWEKYPELH